MKNKKLWYLGYPISIILLISTFIFINNKIAEIILFFISSICFSITYINITHHKMLKKDNSYRINLNDERTEKIRDKSNSSMGQILLFINLCIAIISLIINENISAILIFIVIFISPVVLHLLNNHYERKY